MAIKKLKVDFPGKDLFIDLFGDQVYLVGGTVRDCLLYKKITSSQDIDLVVVNSSYQAIEKKLRRHGKTNTVGRSFAVVKFSYQGNTVDIAVPRRDRKKEAAGHGHTNFTIESGPQVTLEEDLSRRDFTCNSIALRLQDDVLVDPFRGVAAIRNQRIIMTSPESFADDPLRVLRSARFASVHGFSISNDIYRQAKSIPLNELSAERISDELFRLLLESTDPARGLGEYLRLTVLEKLYPELAALATTIQDAHFHPERDEQGHHTVWAHTLITVSIAKKLAARFTLSEEQTLALLLAALLHDAGKATTTRWEFKRERMSITSMFHDSVGVRVSQEILDRLRVETRKNYPLRKTVLNLIQQHHRLYELYRNRQAISFKAITRIVKDMAEEDFLLVLLDFADRRSRHATPLAFRGLDAISRWFLAQKDKYQVNRDTIAPLILGRHLLALGVAPGVAMGRMLKDMYDRQLNGEFKTREDGLAIVSRSLRSLAGKPKHTR